MRRLALSFLFISRLHLSNVRVYIHILIYARQSIRVLILSSRLYEPRWRLEAVPVLERRPYTGVRGPAGRRVQREEHIQAA